MNFDESERLKIKREISDQADILYEKAIELGDHAAEAFEGLNKNERRRHRSQMTGLENIAETTLKVSDVLNYIKKQTARREYSRANLLHNPTKALANASKSIWKIHLRRKRKPFVAASASINRLIRMGETEDKYTSCSFASSSGKLLCI